ncbi:MAG: hypothetical protein QOH01_3007 [Verrucomicrobiota bacterium]|jgi:hypothetical protein
MNKIVAKILKDIAREIANHPEVQKKAKELAMVAAQKAGEIAKASYSRASGWVRDRGIQKRKKVVSRKPVKVRKKPLRNGRKRKA